MHYGPERRDTSLPCTSLPRVALVLLTLFAAPAFAATDSVVLYASQANLSGNLQLQGQAQAATIHYWNQPDDTITWNWQAPRAGHYQAALHYSLAPAMQGGRISLTVDSQRLVAAATPSAAWTDYQTFQLGVIYIDKAGAVSVVLQAAQLPAVPQAALPDVAWLSLTPTDAPSMSESATPAHEFQGKSMFDGATLNGWSGNLKYFRVHEGTIVAGSLSEPIPRNEFLTSAEEYANFELRLDVRLVDGNGNAGVQFRSRREAQGSEMIGYQADVANGFWGGLYDESRRRTFLGTRLNVEAMKAALRPDGWNTYVIRCEGSRVRIWLNEVLTLDYLEPDVAVTRSGLIGLQIHEGEPAEAHYRNLVIQRLP